MKVYLAAGFSVSNVEGREEYFRKVFSAYPWRRLWSYYYLEGEAGYPIVKKTFEWLCKLRKEK